VLEVDWSSVATIICGASSKRDHGLSERCSLRARSRDRHIGDHRFAADAWTVHPVAVHRQPRQPHVL